MHVGRATHGFSVEELGFCRVKPNHSTRTGLIGDCAVISLATLFSFPTYNFLVMYTRIEAGLGRSCSGLGIMFTSLFGRRRLRMIDSIYVLALVERIMYRQGGLWSCICF
jgi:hypothetical protein